MIAQLRKTIAELSREPGQSDTIAALKRQLADILAKQCVHGENTDEPFNTHGCKTCGKPTWVICSNKKVVADRVSSNYCKTCKHKVIRGTLEVRSDT